MIGLEINLALGITIALGILLVFGINGYALYAQLPNSKFTKACKLINKKRFSEAQEIFSRLFSKHPLAVTKYAECFFLQGEEFDKQKKMKEAIEFYNKAIASKSLLNPKSNINSYSKIEVLAYYGIAVLQFNDIPNRYTLDTIRVIKNNLDYIKKVPIESDQRFDELIGKHNIRVGDIYFELGIKDEKENNILGAKSNYSQAAYAYKNLPQDEKYFNTITRNEICNLKINSTPKPKNLSYINRASIPYQADFFYRQAIFHIKHNEFSEAESILDNRLNADNENVKSLKEILLNEKIKSSIDEVADINKQIKELYTDVSSADNALLLYNTISEKATDLNEFIPDIKDELEKLKPSLFNRMLVEYNDKREYSKIISLIIDYPKFYKSPVLMKNLGNSCINYLKKTTLTEDDYKLIISLFLTSAYSDNVMLYSLEETQWDDEYTFSLFDSIGASYELHTQLPDNVNYDEVSESNISIGESQRFLISQFEILLNAQELDSDFLKKTHDFYDSEKKAIEGIISVIPNEITFCTPYFAKKFKIASTIIDELEDDFSQYENDESLEFGISYLFNSRDCRINDYKEAKKTLSELVKSIKKTDLNRFQNSLTEGRKELLLKFDGIRQVIEPTLSEGFDNKISKSSMDENLIPLMKEAIRLSPSNEKLKYQYANFTSILCVSKINNEEMSNFRGLQIMSESYSLLPNDKRVCTNIVALIRMNILDVLSDRGQNASKIYSILNTIKNNRSNSFKSNAGELIKARNEIIEQLPSDARVAIISGLNLNAHGEKIKKCLDYLAELGGSSPVKNIFTAMLEQRNLANILNR